MNPKGKWQIYIFLVGVILLGILMIFLIDWTMHL